MKPIKYLEEAEELGDRAIYFLARIIDMIDDAEFFDPNLDALLDDAVDLVDEWIELQDRTMAVEPQQ